MGTKHAVITLDFESDYAGRLEGKYESWAKDTVTSLHKILDRYHVPLSVFVVGAELGSRSDSILQNFKKKGAEFHLHSYSHNLTQADSQEEIVAGAKAFKKHFGHNPVGYRAPEGRITLQGLQVLREQGFEFDSSLFPSLIPEPSWYFKSDSLLNNGIITEIPISTVGHSVLPCSLSWMKVVGESHFLRMFDTTQEQVVFDFHLHDLAETPSRKQLSFPHRQVYSIRKDMGLQYLDTFLSFLLDHNYSFSTISTIL